MYILAFETTGEYASVACIDEKGNITEQKSESVLSHLKSLIPMTEHLMKERQIVMSDVSCVAVSAGPGSFTGIRIGVSSARAIAQAVSIPCISVPTLTSFIYNTENYKGLVCPVLDAGRSRIYAGAYFKDGLGDVREATGGGAYDIGEYLQLLHSGITEHGISEVMFFGDGAKVYKNEIEKWQNTLKTSIQLPNDNIRFDFAEEAVRGQKASSVAKHALKLYNEGKHVSYEELTPIYMRKAEAERKLDQMRINVNQNE